MNNKIGRVTKLDENYNLSLELYEIFRACAGK